MYNILKFKVFKYIPIIPNFNSLIKFYLFKEGVLRSYNNSWKEPSPDKINILRFETVCFLIKPSNFERNYYPSYDIKTVEIFEVVLVLVLKVVEYILLIEFSVVF